MATKVIKIKKRTPQRDRIKIAADVIRRGGLVAFPTETVYGLGANALDKSAVKKIFRAKGRPGDNPLIVHLGYKKDLGRLISNMPSFAKKLIKEYWPGPLTLIFKKRRIVPTETTGGLNTVAVRMPKNPIALALIRHSGVPVAAPSANISGRPSPTTAQHVIDDLYGKIEIIVDGGKTEVGIESTVLDCSTKIPVILRPGKVTRKEIEKLIGPIEGDAQEIIDRLKFPRSPGMKYRHYAPKAPIWLIKGRSDVVLRDINKHALAHRKSGKKVGILMFGERRSVEKQRYLIIVDLGKNRKIVTRHLFDALRFFDKSGVDLILVQNFPGKDIAIANRLEKAASKIFIIS